MFAVLGGLSILAGAALLRYAMVANRRAVKPAWTSSWVINGSMAPAVITLFAIGVILIVQFALDFAPGTAAVVEALVAAVLIASTALIWRKLQPEAEAPRSAPIHMAAGTPPSPANGPAAPTAGAPARAGRGRKKAA